MGAEDNSTERLIHTASVPFTVIRPPPTDYYSRRIRLVNISYRIVCIYSPLDIVRAVCLRSPTAAARRCRVKSTGVYKAPLTKA